MNITVINGSPKGVNSVTLQTLNYLMKCYPKHDYHIIDVGQRIKQYEKDFSSIKDILNNANLIVFAYPVYTFIAPYQLHRFIELLKENHVDLSGKIATQITTSKHFYDVTAHKYIEANIHDFKMKYIKGLSADMDDLLNAKGRKEAEQFFESVMFAIQNNIFEPPHKIELKERTSNYKASLKETTKNEKVNVAIVTNYSEDDENLINMIADFKAILPYNSKIINVRDFPFTGGCLGCFSCATTGKCIYKDGFDDFLRNEIQCADAIVYAFTIDNHYTHSSFKCYDDRQFCNGHRTVTEGMPVGYLISGNYQDEDNLKVIVEGRCEVGGNYLSYVATDENNTINDIENLSKCLVYAYEHKLERPKNFYGVGGTKIFRDLIYVMRGLMKADHKFYKEHGIYDFPQKQRGTILKMQAVGLMMAIPSVQKKMRGQMNEYILMPYKKIIDETKERGK